MVALRSSWFPRPRAACLGIGAGLHLLLVLRSYETDGSHCKAYDLQPTLSRDAAHSILGVAYAAYCPLNEIQNWSCYWCALTDRPLSRVQAFLEPHSQLQYFIGEIDTGASGHRAWMLSFRGTVMNAGKRTLYSNMYFSSNRTLTRVATVAGVDGTPAVHGGWSTQWHLVRPHVLAALSQLRGPSTSARETLVLTGHSSGASLTSIAAYDLVTSPELDARDCWDAASIAVVNFGMPPVGNRAFAAAYEAVGLGARTWRLVHEAEEVPHAFPMFTHVGREIWERANGTWQRCAAFSGATSSSNARPTRCDHRGAPNLDMSCSSSVPASVQTHADHHLYLGLDCMVGEQFGCMQ